MAAQVTAFSGTLPSRTAGQTTAQFNANANDLFTWMTGDLVTDINTLATEAETDASNASTSATNAATSETNAATSANNAATSETNASTYADNAASSANFKGNWSAQTGAANKPYSVYHSNRTWNLVNNLADVTTSEPGVTSDWVLVSSGAILYLSEATLSTDSAIDFTLPSGYNSYLFKFYNVYVGTTLSIRTSTDGGSTFDSGASDYRYTRIQALDNASTVSASSSTGASLVQLTSLGESINGDIEVAIPSDADNTMTIFNLTAKSATDITARYSGSGQRVSAADVDAIRFLASGSTLDTGKIVMYGVL